ncbi:MAG: DUF3368 domain-containing protein [Planctomycetota bacterium]
MIVVSDTSPLNYLVLIHREHILPTLFGRVVTPPAVITELLHPTSPALVRSWAEQPPVWLEIRSPMSLLPQLKLGRGESEALSLARELGADAVLIDERRGYMKARQLGLFATGTLGVLEVAAERKLINLPATINLLLDTSFRISPELLRSALERDANRSMRK